MSQHHAKFTWGAGPNSVSVAGGFNNWSDSATRLDKQSDGSFAADIPMPWGEKQAFKYVVDGEWKVREDEAKEWDAAGNMNNVYTAPHAPAPVHDTPAPAAVAESTPEHKEVPAATAVAPSTTETAPAAESTKVDNLLASSAPAAASAGHGLGAYNLGAIVAGGGVNTGARTVDSVTIPTVPAVAAVPAAAAPSSVNKATAVPVVPAPAPVIATAAVPIAAAPVVTDPTPVQIIKLAANANIGEAPTGHEDKSIQERATEFGTGALAAISAAATQAAAAVERQTGVDPVAAIERATGVDLHHGSPISIADAKSRGIDVNHIPKTDAEAHASSPAGTKPPISAVDALEEKAQELKIATGASGVPSQQKSVPLPGGQAPKSSFANAPEPLHNHGKDKENDLPAQDEVKNHSKVPATIITPVSAKDPRKDRTLNADNGDDTAGTKPISSDPSISAVDAKKDAERHPAGSGSTPDVAQGRVTETKSNQNSTPAAVPSRVAPGETIAKPDATNVNPHMSGPATPAKDTTSTPAAVAPAPVAAAPSAPVAAVPVAAAPVAATPAAPVAAAPVVPSTPVKAAPSAASTPASTPAKSSHAKEGTANSDIRKRKSSFFTKIKSAFSPKDKEKK